MRLHEIQPARLIYPSDGPVSGYYHHHPDPVVPVYWLTDEIARQSSGRSLGICAPISPRAWEVSMEWLTIQEAAELLRVKVSWIYERTRTNSIPHVKLGKYLRFDRDELIAWVADFKRDGRRAEPDPVA